MSIEQSQVDAIQKRVMQASAAKKENPPDSDGQAAIEIPTSFYTPHVIICMVRATFWALLVSFTEWHAVFLHPDNAESFLLPLMVGLAAVGSTYYVNSGNIGWVKIPIIDRLDNSTVIAVVLTFLFNTLTMIAVGILF